MAFRLNIVEALHLTTRMIDRLIAIKSRRSISIQCTNGYCIRNGLVCGTWIYSTNDPDKVQKCDISTGGGGGKKVLSCHFKKVQ